MSRELPTPADPQHFASLDPDLILPEQFFHDPEPEWSGELSLLWTVYTDGLDAFRREILRGNESSELFIETVAWIEETGSDSIFAFENLCEVFHVEPGWMRRWLYGWRSRYHAAIDFGQKAA